MDSVVASPAADPGTLRLDEAQTQQVRALARRDAEVRAHEQAHASVGGVYASAPTYEYQRGPNGVNYAVGGHVDIDVAVVPGDPAATLAKMTVVRRAALAVAEPSPADRAVAAKASAQASQARAQLSAQAGQSDPLGPASEASAQKNHNNPTDSLGASVDISV